MKHLMILSVGCVATPFSILVGDTISITSEKLKIFTLSGSVLGIVVGLIEDPTNRRITVEVWI